MVTLAFRTFPTNTFALVVFSMSHKLAFALLFLEHRLEIAGRALGRLILFHMHLLLIVDIKPFGRLRHQSDRVQIVSNWLVGRRFLATIIVSRRDVPIILLDLLTRRINESLHKP